mgnify:CR=1 FL=1
MKNLINDFPEYDLVMIYQLGPDEHAVLLSREGAYSVCKMRPRRMIAMSPNYAAGGYGLLVAPLTSSGLSDLLQWDSYATATARFREMTELPANVVSFLPAKRTSG